MKGTMDTQATLKNIVLATFLLGLLILILFFVQGQRNPLCEPALFLGSPGHDPSSTIERVIAETGGLPQVDADLARISDQRQIVPVEDWRIRSAVVQNSSDHFLQMLRDVRARVRYAIDLDVTWQDGARGILQWTAQRRGFVSCPVVVFRGGGPVGAVRIVLLTPAPPPEPTPEK